MYLPPSSPSRVPKRRRLIDVQAYARADGLWEVDARVSDVKTHETPGADGVRTAGAPIHALVRHGVAVKLRHPRWFRQPRANKVTQNRPPVSPVDPSPATAEQAAPPLSS
jgi:hypothetical protein